MGGTAFSYHSSPVEPVWVQGTDTLSVFKAGLRTLLLDRQKQEALQSRLVSLGLRAPGCCKREDS